MAIPKNLIETAKTQFDLTRAEDQASLLALADSLLALPDLSIDELLLVARDKLTPLEFKIAVKLVQSRRFLIQNKKAIKIGIVCAMWGEQNRLLPRSDDNPNGEDVLRVKLNQLQWALKDTPVDWALYLVDDGCPHGSGNIAEGIAKDHPLRAHLKVLYLDEKTPVNEGPLAKLKSADDSQKGGAIILGCMEALEDEVDAVIYTDTDNSVHLAQLGLLLEPHINQGINVVLGNRKDPNAVLVKQESRWGIGIKLLRHMQRMVGKPIFSRGILDSQAAFKLYHRDILQRIIHDPTVYNFSFDTDWIAAVIAMDEAFTKVPFAFVDSFAESASIEQGPMTTWIVLLKGLVMAMRKHGLTHNEAMALVLDEEILTSADLDILIHHLPPELEKADDNELGNPDVMSPQAVKAWINKRKEEQDQI